MEEIERERKRVYEDELDPLEWYKIELMKDKRRIKRSSASPAPASNKTKKEIVLKKTNSASTFLGLTVLLDAESEEYAMGSNDFYGFRVRFVKLRYASSPFICK